MSEKIDSLKKKIIEFQTNIVELKSNVHNQKQQFTARETNLMQGLFEILDDFENLETTIQKKENEFDKTTKRLMKSFRSVNKKLIRLLKRFDIFQIEFLDNKAVLEYCKIVDTEKRSDLESETIITLVKNGYINKKNNVVLRKAAVVTATSE
mgnify:FL=1